jgi:HipA-like protein
MGRISLSDTPDGIGMVAPIAPSTAGGSGSFLALGDDGRRYWCKTLNNLQNARVPVCEQIVARLGDLLGIAGCRSKLINIPPTLAGWQFHPSGKQLETGWAHGSVPVDPALETRALDHRTDDENAVRQAGFFVLYDWLLGADPQWLIATADENAYHSHDHGYYLGGPEWSEASLTAALGAPHELGMPGAGLSDVELARLAGELETLSAEQVIQALSGLPLSWPITEDELEAVLEFSMERRQDVADRARSLST